MYINFIKINTNLGIFLKCFSWYSEVKYDI